MMESDFVIKGLSATTAEVQVDHSIQMLSSSVTTILFDLDGTLIDSVELILESYRHTVRVHGLDSASEQDWRDNLGIPLRVQFRQFTEDPDEVQAMISTYLTHNTEHHDTLIGEYPGMRDAVVALHRAGYRLGVVTSKMHGGLERGLRAGGYEGLFEILIGADDVENPKPHAEPVLKALEQMGVESESAVFVGDSPHDMTSGRAAGVQTAAALWGPFAREVLEPAAPDHWLDEPGDVRRLFLSE